MQNRKQDICVFNELQTKSDPCNIVNCVSFS